MKRQLLVGSALGLLMAAASAHAGPGAMATAEPHQPGMMLLAQDEAAPVEELLPKKKRKKGGGEQAAPESQAAPEPQAESEPAQQQAEEAKPKKRRKPAVEEAAPQPEALPETEPAQQQAEEAKPKKRRKPVVEEAAPQPEALPETEPAQQQAEEAKPKKRKPVVQEAAPQPEAQPDTEPAQQQAEEAKPKKRKPVVQEAAPQPEAQPETEPAQQAEEAKPKKRKQGTADPNAVQTGEQATPEVQPNAPAQEKVPGTDTAEQPAEAAPGAVEPEAPTATTGAQPAEPAQEGTAAAQPENAAPVLDSAKEEPAAPDQAGTGSVATAKPRKPAAPPAPPPADDRAAQAEVRTERVETVTAETGTRIEQAPPPVPLAVARPQGVDVLREIGDRVVVQIANQIVVESSDRPRLARDSREVYYEELSGGRTRETVIRADGTRVVTVRNEYGDIIRRSRITQDDREYVIAYVDERDYQRIGDWRDPGDDLPPMRLDVPVEEYVLDADQVEDVDTYYAFLERPPVERVERLYSVDEVKRSARIRDKLPRIELDTVTFEFGSAEIAEDQVQRLQGVAEAMERLLKKNPAESFLIEGHTDAIGSDVANLALSDRRAEAVAQALTNVFGIAPENLATQGYGERYLKIKTDEAEQANRRVVMRRITPLVAPVASAE